MLKPYQSFLLAAILLNGCTTQTVITPIIPPVIPNSSITIAVWDTNVPPPDFVEALAIYANQTNSLGTQTRQPTNFFTFDILPKGVIVFTARASNYDGEVSCTMSNELTITNL